jgi:oxygen-independent coproporphyrinogen-3 oxidase
MSAPLDPLTGVAASRLGIYVHFPYCLARCPYCDFAVTVSRGIPQERYSAALSKELRMRVEARPGLSEAPVHSIFLGGGTPSLWEPPRLRVFLEEVRGRLLVAEDAEVTLEANPEGLTEELLEGFRAAGVTRLSLGVQSFDDASLRALGRAHSEAEAKAAVRVALQAGFQSVAVDLIYGAPGQRVAQAVEDARVAAGLGVHHVSAYALTVERQALGRETAFTVRLGRGQLRLPDDEQQASMAEGVAHALEEAGLTRYEVSNFSRPGASSVHNALYWTGGEYLGLGTAAVGLLRDRPGEAVRETNLSRTEAYLEAVEAARLPTESSEALGARELFEERLAMGLRLTAGLRLEALCRDFGEPYEPRRREAERLARDGFARFDGERLALTSKGLLLHSEIAARLI